CALRHAITHGAVIRRPSVSATLPPTVTQTGRWGASRNRVSRRPRGCGATSRSRDEYVSVAATGLGFAGTRSKPNSPCEWSGKVVHSGLVARSAPKIAPAGAPEPAPGRAAEPAANEQIS